MQIDESAFFPASYTMYRRFSLAIGSSGDDAKTPGKSGGLVCMLPSSLSLWIPHPVLSLDSPPSSLFGFPTQFSLWIPHPVLFGFPTQFSLWIPHPVLSLDSPPTLGRILVRPRSVHVWIEGDVAELTHTCTVHLHFPSNLTRYS